MTHDQVEAMTLGDRVAVLRRGVLQQCDTPQALFARPANLFVAAFIGSPAMNLVEATVEGGEARFGACRIAAAARVRRLPARVILGLRPHHLEPAAGADAAWPRIAGVVEVVEELGTETQLVVGIDAPRLRADAVRDALDAAPGRRRAARRRGSRDADRGRRPAHPPGHRRARRAGHRPGAAARVRPGDGRGDRPERRSRARRARSRDHPGAGAAWRRTRRSGPRATG